MAYKKTVFAETNAGTGIKVEVSERMSGNYQLTVFDTDAESVGRNQIL